VGQTARLSSLNEIRTSWWLVASLLDRRAACPTVSMAEKTCNWP